MLRNDANRFLTRTSCFTFKYNDVLEVTGNNNAESEQMNYSFLYFTPYSHPPAFDMIERKGMRRNYRGKA